MNHQEELNQLNHTIARSATDLIHATNARNLPAAINAWTRLQNNQSIYNEMRRWYVTLN